MILALVLHALPLYKATYQLLTLWTSVFTHSYSTAVQAKRCKKSASVKETEKENLKWLLRQPHDAPLFITQSKVRFAI